MTVLDSLSSLSISSSASSSSNSPLKPSSSTSSTRLNPLSASFVPTGILAPDTSPEADAQILEALKSTKDRIFVLKLGESFEGLISDRLIRTRLECPAQTTYQRLLVHRCAAYYKLQPESDPNTKSLTAVAKRPSTLAFVSEGVEWLAACQSLGPYRQVLTSLRTADPHWARRRILTREFALRASPAVHPRAKALSHAVGVREPTLHHRQ
ncbi:hypothetical protein AURDEDRAFT_169773 [Auricularia subglabra TFB-10046 SS5]|nr:hypothetical protein AURDEDRAFT_169773 [Auricularia subglabra TFB-10046 SS5]